MRGDSLAVAALLVGVGVLALGSLATLAVETLVGVRPFAAAALLLVALVGTIVLGARFGGRLATPYW